MSRFDEIIQVTEEIVDTYGTRNPRDLADDLDVTVMYRDFNQQKGVFTTIEGQPFVFVNNNLVEEQQNIVLAHELGHFLLHLDELGASPMLVEENFFNKSSNRQEYEANLFTSQLLLPDDEILEHIGYGRTQLEIAQAMGSDVNLVAMKIETLMKQGYALRGLEYQRNFL